MKRYVLLFVFIFVVMTQLAEAMQCAVAEFEEKMKAGVVFTNVVLTTKAWAELTGGDVGFTGKNNLHVVGKQLHFMLRKRSRVI
ncbi:MAG: hypothetical protein ACI9F2_000691 [Lysobacterales bacterium]|jgi:hypothetical protein